MTLSVCTEATLNDTTVTYIGLYVGNKILCLVKANISMKNILVALVIGLSVVVAAVIYVVVKLLKNDEDEAEEEEDEDFVPFDVKDKVPETKWDFVDKILYINLDHRTDRRKRMEEILSVVPDQSKIIRVPAIEFSPGSMGCTMSHIKALSMAIQNNWKNVLILEDDAEWNNYSRGYANLVKLIERYPDYDVISLGNTFTKFDRTTSRLFQAQSACSYLVAGHYYQKLFQNFTKGLELYVEKQVCSKYCIDVYWGSLMEEDKWYVVNPCFVVQRPGLSDIEKGDTNYLAYFNLEEGFLPKPRERTYGSL